MVHCRIVVIDHPDPNNATSSVSRSTTFRQQQGHGAGQLLYYNNNWINSMNNIAMNTRNNNSSMIIMTQQEPHPADAAARHPPNVNVAPPMPYTTPPPPVTFLSSPPPAGSPSPPPHHAQTSMMPQALPHQQHPTPVPPITTSSGTSDFKHAEHPHSLTQQQLRFHHPPAEQQHYQYYPQPAFGYQQNYNLALGAGSASALANGSGFLYSNLWGQAPTVQSFSPLTSANITAATMNHGGPFAVPPIMLYQYPTSLNQNIKNLNVSLDTSDKTPTNPLDLSKKTTTDTTAAASRALPICTTNMAVPIFDFDKNFSALEQFKTKHRHFRVPLDYPDHPGLALWCNLVRQAYSRRNRKFGGYSIIELSDAQIQKLKDIGFTLYDEPKRHYTFLERLEGLKLFKSIYRHCRIPKRYKPDPSLGAWCCEIRASWKQLNKGKRPRTPLTPRMIDALTEVGFFPLDPYY